MKLPTTLSFRPDLQIAVSQISSDNKSVRVKNIEILKSYSEIAIPILERILNRCKDHRQQFFTAAALHQLGHPRGLQFLMGFLLWRLPTSSSICQDLELAIMEIDSPAVSTALLDVWASVPLQSENAQVFQIICGLCAAKKDIRILEILYGSAHRHTDLFIETCERFDELSLPYIEKMLKDGDAVRRKLAVETAHRVKSPRLYNLLVYALRDTSPEVRQAVPAALYTIDGGIRTADEIETALLEGWSSPAAIHVLLNYNRLNSEICTAIINRWPSCDDLSIGDSDETISAVLNYLTKSSVDPPLCALIGLLTRDITSDIAMAALSYIAAKTEFSQVQSETIIRAILPWLSSINPKMRTAASAALAGFGCTLGTEFELLLSSQIPRDSSLHKLKLVLKSPPHRLNLYIPHLEYSTQSIVDDEELWREAACVHERANLSMSTLLLLRRIAKDMIHSRIGSEVEELLLTGVAVIRSCSSLEILDTKPFCNELRNIVLQVNPVSEVKATSSWQVFEAVIGILRAEAAAALVRISRDAGFVLCIQAVCHTRVEVQIAGASILGLIGDPRAIPLLLPLQNSTDINLRDCAKSSIRSIQQQNPDIITLLRGSEKTQSGADLLRTLATGVNIKSDELLRQSQANSR